MKEFTVIMNAQITMIFDEEAGHSEESLKAITPEIYAKTLSRVLGGDVNVKNLKLFVGEKKEADDGTAE